jgi:hypothetical protein
LGATSSGEYRRFRIATQSTPEIMPPRASSRASILARGLGVGYVIGTEKIRLASRPQLGHATVAIAVPIGIRCSKQPQSPQR